MKATLSAAIVLLLTRREAARSLSISERKLDDLVKQNVIRAVRFGRCVRFDPADLQQWIASQKGGSNEPH